MYNGNAIKRLGARNKQFSGLQYNSLIASRDVKINHYRKGMLKDIHLRVNLVEPVVHEFQSGPHKPGKTRQQDDKEDRGNGIPDWLADLHEEEEVH